MKDILGNHIQQIGSNTKEQFRDGEVIVQVGKRTTDCYYITRGCVKVYDLNSDGTIKTIGILVRGDMFPLIWGFDHPPETAYYYKAMGDVSVLKFSTADLKQSLVNNPELSHCAMMQFVNLTWDFMERIKSLQMPYTYEKLLRLLPYLAAKTGKPRGENSYVIQQKITQEEIAQMIGATRESISAHLAKLEKNGVITRKKGIFTIHIDNVPEEYIHHNWFKEARLY